MKHLVIAILTLVAFSLTIAFGATPIRNAGGAKFVALLGAMASGIGLTLMAM